MQAMLRASTSAESSTTRSARCAISTCSTLNRSLCWTLETYLPQSTALTSISSLCAVSGLGKTWLRVKTRVHKEPLGPSTSASRLPVTVSSPCCYSVMWPLAGSLSLTMRSQQAASLARSCILTARSKQVRAKRAGNESAAMQAQPTLPLTRTPTSRSAT